MTMRRTKARRIYKNNRQLKGQFSRPVMKDLGHYPMSFTFWDNLFF
jgi:hypothetical protein